MNRASLYRALTLLSVLLTITAFYIIVFIKPALASTDPSMKTIFYWFTVFSTLSGMLNLRQISIMCKTREEGQQSEIFSSKGRFILRNSPSTYFTDETLKEYKMHQRIYVIFFIISIAALYFLLNSSRFGITIPFMK